RPEPYPLPLHDALPISSIGYGDVRPLAPVSVRLGLLLLLALVWGLGGVLMRTRRSKEEQALLAGLRRQQEEKDAEADRESADIRSEEHTSELQSRENLG